MSQSAAAPVLPVHLSTAPAVDCPSAGRPGRIRLASLSRSARAGRVLSDGSGRGEHLALRARFTSARCTVVALRPRSWSSVPVRAQVDVALQRELVELARARQAAPSRPALGSRQAAPALPSLRITRRGRVLITGAVLLVTLAACAILAALGLAPVAAAATSHDDGARAAAARPVVAEARPQARTVTVLPGQTLWQIAQQVAPERDPRDVALEIRDANRLADSRVYAGQVLILPSS